MTLISHHTPPCRCIACNAEIDACTNLISDCRPNSGDITVCMEPFVWNVDISLYGMWTYHCMECGHIMAFADDLTIRDLTDDEMLEVAGNPLIIALQEARGKVMKK